MPTPLRDGVARPVATSSAAADALGPLPAPGRAASCWNPRRTPAPPRNCWCRCSRRASGLVAGADFHVGYSPERIDPGNPTWTFDNTPKIVSGIDAASLEAVERFYGRLVDHDGAGPRHSGGGAGQAAREHVPPRQHRARQRARRVRPRPRHRRLGGRSTRRRRSRSASCGSARPRRRRALPADRPVATCRGRCSARLGQRFRFVELANDVNDHMPDYVVRRSCSRSTSCAVGQRRPLLLLGLAYKKNTGDCPRVAGRRGRRAARRSGCRRPRGRPDRRLLRRGPRRRGSRPSTRRSRRPTCVIVLTDHDAFDWTGSVARAQHVFDTRHRLTGAHVAHL